MIAVICFPSNELHVVMLPDTPKMRLLLANVQREYGSDVTTNSDSLEQLIKDAPRAEGLVDSTATFFYRREW